MGGMFGYRAQSGNTAAAGDARTIRVNFGGGGPPDTWLYYTPTLTADLNGAARIVFSPTDFVSFVDFKTFFVANGTGYYTVTAPNDAGGGDFTFLNTFSVTSAPTDPADQSVLHTLTDATDIGNGINVAQTITAVQILDAGVEITINYQGS